MFAGVVSSNSTAGEGAVGGGLTTQSTATVTDSTVHDNRVLALDEAGGGVWAASHVTITRSTISANELAAVPMVGGGGGVASQTGYILVTDSVVRDNVTHGWNASGGGIRAIAGPVEIRGSLIAGNQSGGRGGGVTDEWEGGSPRRDSPVGPAADARCKTGNRKAGLVAIADHPADFAAAISGPAIAR